jgi:UDP-N-acetylglucosamine--N-acetylmuramyl-(pentapeptide) pyrophosphoryl-undecaprenol N-acetylglucosamine transferase
MLPAALGTLVGLTRLFMRYRPSLVVGTGGYVSGPACLWAVLTATPMAIQEQNSHPGFTTRVLSRWAQQVHLGFPEAASKLKPGSHTKLLSAGNPIRPPDPSLDRAVCREAFGLQPDSRVLLVVGGSQGARALNEALLGVIENVVNGTYRRPADVEILWATGATQYENVSARLEAAGSPAWVHAINYIENMPAGLAVADVAVSRAGAMATAELLAWGIPMVLIPLPTAAADHQRFNAGALEAAGAAVVIEESKLSRESLWSAIDALMTDPSRYAAMRAAALKRARPDAAREIAANLLALVKA